MAHLWNDWNSIEAAFRDSMSQHRFSVIILHCVRTLGILQDEHLHTASAKSTSNGRLVLEDKMETRLFTTRAGNQGTRLALTINAHPLRIPDLLSSLHICSENLVQGIL